jgi:magnesium-protoporphyrin IX monomethyl ester (oxidative) cyclase
LAYIASVLEQNGYDVRCLDATEKGAENEITVSKDRFRFGLSPAKIKEIIKEFNPKYVGVSVLYTCQAPNGHMICSIAKNIDKKTITIMGGAYPTSDPERALGDPNLDFVINGEGEKTIVELLEAIESKKAYQDIQGISFRKKGGIRINPAPPFIQDLDSLPFPARHLFNFQNYSKSDYAHGSFKKTPLASIITSRGCPFNCAFCFTCKMTGARFRTRSVENIISEIQILKETYHIKELHFEDDNLLFNKKRAEQLFDEMIARKFNLCWTTPNGIAVNNLDKKILLKMKRSGMYSLIIAAESGNAKVLKHILRKPIKLEKIEEAVRILKQIKVPVQIYWMIGLPGETKEEMEDTIRLAEKLNTINPSVYSSFSCYTPFKGTRLYDTCMEQKFIDEEKEIGEFKYCKSVLNTPEFTSAYVTRLRKIAWQRANKIESDEDLRRNEKLKSWI